MPKRMQRGEIVLKKFGLLDRDFNLKPFMLALLKEQIQSSMYTVLVLECNAAICSLSRASMKGFRLKSRPAGRTFLERFRSLHAFGIFILVEFVGQVFLDSGARS